MKAAEESMDADIVVLNTCHIRGKAAEKVYSDSGRLKREDGTRPMSAVGGCVAQAEGAEVPRRARAVDRTEACREGEGCVSRWRARGWPSHKNTKTTNVDRERME